MSMDPLIEIAPLRASEHARWLQLWGAYQRFYEVDLPAEATAATWARLHEGRIHGLGARNASGELLGFVHYLFHADTWSTLPACYLQDLYVDSSARGKGRGGCGRGRRQQSVLADTRDESRCAPALRQPRAQLRLHPILLRPACEHRPLGIEVRKAALEIFELRQIVERDIGRARM